MSNPEVKKYIAILQELETSHRLIKLGFGELQNLNICNKFYFLPFQLLSQGFERYMKAYICLGYLNEFKTYPNSGYLKSLGHNLQKLLNEILCNYYFEFDNPQYELDNSFITTNTDLNELLYILSSFGNMGRYYNFDMITESKKIGVNAEDKWREFENKILDDEDLLKLTKDNLSHEVNHKVSNYIIILFEKYISALSRQFIFNCLGKKASQLAVSNFYDFGKLYEKDFGNTDYRYQTTQYSKEPRKLHKRTLVDKFQRKLNPQYQSKKIVKDSYEGDWPFYSDEVVIECREKHWCIVTINGSDYALNGAASSRYNLDNPHKAGMARLGVSLSDFIDKALKL